VQERSFEEWVLQVRAFDLVFSAQAWHWVCPEVRLVRAAAALVPAGCLALLWHLVRWQEDDPVRVALDACYRLHAPKLHAAGPGSPGLTLRRVEAGAEAEVARSADFFDVAVHERTWDQTFDATGYVDRLRTQSDHRLLPSVQAARLFEAVSDVIVDHGGRVTVPHATVLVLGRRNR
ncbi:MAG: hypothetical protein ACRDL8_10645, partial [Solirubrobacteraceae bacterium]